MSKEDKEQQLTVKVSMTDLDLFKRVSKLITNMVSDDRIDIDIRDEYYCQLLDVMNESSQR